MSKLGEACKGLSDDAINPTAVLANTSKQTNSPRLAALVLVGGDSGDYIIAVVVLHCSAALVADANSRSARFQAAGAEHVVVDGDAHCAVVVSAALAGVGQCHLAQLGRQQTGVVDGGAPAGHSQQLIVYLIASTAKTDVVVEDGVKVLHGADQGNVVLQLAGVVRRMNVHTGHAGNVAAKVVDVGVVANLVGGRGDARKLSCEKLNQSNFLL